MRFIKNNSLILIFLIGLINGNIHNVCEICSCDNLDQPIVVHCDSKKLSTLENITFYSSIQTLSFIDNSLTFKSVDDLEKINNLTSLQSLVLSNNPLETIPAFSSNHLVTLQLENTHLKSATFPESYQNCTKLQSIVLSSNKLVQISSDNFKSLSSLTKLSIDNSQIYLIENDTFISLSNTLQSISLISNSLISAEFLPMLNHLLSINFDNNNFTALPNEIIEPGSIKHFFFRDNKIEIINELSPLAYWMKSNISNIDIYLNNNPFDCCQSRWFIHYLSGSKNLVKDSFNLTCASPRIYSGQRLIDLHADLMRCPGDPPKVHVNKHTIVILCLIGIISFILIVVGMTLNRRNLRRQREYQRVEGDTFIPASI